MSYGRLLVGVLFSVALNLHGQVLLINEVGGQYWQKKCDQECLSSVEQFKDSIYVSGHLLANFKQTASGDSIFLKVEKGPVFKWAEIVPDEIASSLMLMNDTLSFSGKVFNPTELHHLFKEIVSYFENNGYPFVAVGLDSIDIFNFKIRARLKITKGPEVSELKVVDENGNLKSPWLNHFLGIGENELYNQVHVDMIADKLKRFGFGLLSPPVLVYAEQGPSILNIRTYKMEKSTLDGIIGVAGGGMEDKAIIAGYLDLSFINLLHAARKLDISWRRMRPETQRVTADYFHPSFLSNRIDLNGRFFLHKEDTSFINRSIDAVVMFALAKNMHIHFSTELQRGHRLMSHSGFPEAADFNIMYYGTGFSWIKNNFVLENKLSAGNKGHLTSEGSALQVKLEGKLSYRVPLSKYWVSNLKLESSKMIGRELYINDLFRVGGLNSLRGFLENQFYTSSFVLSNMELRRYFGAESYGLFFYDATLMAIENNLNEIIWPWGIGAGFNLAMEKGELRLLFAWGKNTGESFNMLDIKAHIGYLAKF